MIDFDKEPLERAMFHLTPEMFIQEIIDHDNGETRMDRRAYFKQVGALLVQQQKRERQLRKLQPKCGHLTVKGLPCQAKRIPGRDGCKYHTTDKRGLIL